MLALNGTTVQFTPMRRIIQVVLLIAVAATSVAAQQTYYSIYSYDGFIPELVISERPAELQASLFPEHYQSASASADMKWVSENDSAIVEFLTTRVDTILHVLRELSGIEWQETNLELFLVRYYPTLGSSRSPDPACWRNAKLRTNRSHPQWQ